MSINNDSNMIIDEDHKAPLSVTPLHRDLFCIRAITAFINLESNDFSLLNDTNESGRPKGEAIPDGIESGLQRKLANVKHVLTQVQSALEEAGYKVQTQRIATNPFSEWAIDRGNADENALHTDETDVPIRCSKKARENISGDKKAESSSAKVMELKNKPQDDSSKELNKRMKHLDQCLQNIQIEFCSVGPAQTASPSAKALEQAVEDCVTIVGTSPRLSCSFPVAVNNVDQAKAAAKCCLRISRLGMNDENSDKNSRSSSSFCHGGLGNFRFCSASTTCQPYIPFFPVAYSGTLTSEKRSTASTRFSDSMSIGIGLENGSLACHLLKKCGTIQSIPTIFKSEMEQTLSPIQNICRGIIDKVNSSSTNSTHTIYRGIDTSLNPSLDGFKGSVASAIEQLDEVSEFGGCGTLAAAAAITTVLQSLSNIQRTGYCGLMLPVCEDRRLAELAATKMTSSTTAYSAASSSRLSITQLLNISSVCGVGVDTVPLRGNVSADVLSMLILDVVGLATRWNKPLSCRVFPVPDITQCNEMTTFDFEHLCNTRVFELS